MTIEPVHPPKPWWGKFKLNIKECQSWDFGSMNLTLHRLEKEWTLRSEYKSIDLNEELNDPVTKFNKSLFDAGSSYKRFVFTKSPDTLEVHPRPPDRNLVAKPVNSIQLLPKQEITLFVGAVLWFSIMNPDHNKVIHELPVRRVSDTWFGPSPLFGELAYSSKTNAFIDSHEVRRKLYRAVVPITIRNDSSEPMLIEKINVPVLLLDLYIDDKMQLWTNPITLVREKNNSDISIRIQQASDIPYFSGSVTSPLATARKPQNNNIVTRTYDMLFS